jgi:DNA mismatch endonuclease, patch repair protein
LPDIVAPEVRSRMMAGIRSADTRPEMLIRRGLHARGFRYRLHLKDLPGKPDLVFPARRAVILVNGCFWHGHDCPLFRWPTTRPEFWRTKIAGNIARDRKTARQLLDQGWRVLNVWECTLKGRDRLAPDDVLTMCVAFLDSQDQWASIGSAQTVTVEDSA